MAKDSIFVASTVIRKILHVKLTDFDVHINFIGGGNVDGPSAGAALTMALISAIQNRPLRQDMAMTGEISLQGHLKPVGGLYGKLFGASRAGMKAIIIPEENRKELPDHMYNVQLIPVRTIEQAMEMMLL
ncbi:Lon protease 2 [bioreactor metagenome]|uniref:Lon protease 2 n=1 Tax=bioreactor metagenome TaxID=1076179 RepID=A0A645J2U9_9ZZZZ